MNSPAMAQPNTRPACQSCQPSRFLRNFSLMILFSCRCSLALLESQVSALIASTLRDLWVDGVPGTVEAWDTLSQASIPGVYSTLSGPSFWPSRAYAAALTAEPATERHCCCSTVSGCHRGPGDPTGQIPWSGRFPRRLRTRTPQLAARFPGGLGGLLSASRRDNGCELAMHALDFCGLLAAVLL